MVTLTSNYREIFTPETVKKIDDLVEDLYDLECMLVFIDEYSEEFFITCYETYVEFGEDYSYEAVDTFLRKVADDYTEIKDFPDAYVGRYDTRAEFAAEMLEDDISVHPCVIIDWYETAELLMDDYVEYDCFYFRRYY